MSLFVDCITNLLSQLFISMPTRTLYDHCSFILSDEKIEDTNPYSLNHATMFYHALNNGTINAKNSVQIGVRERNGMW